MNLLRRVSRMTRHEVAFRVRTAIRTQAQRAAVHAIAPRWDRRALRRVLDRHRLPGPAAALLARGDWDGLERQLRTVIRGRPASYVLQPGRADSTRTAVLERWPGAARDAAGEADRILAGRYDLLGYFDLAIAPDAASIDWHHDPVHGRAAPRRFWADVPFLDPACGDHKIIWELNRHQHFLRLGRALWLTHDRRYGHRIVGEVQSWLAANPPLVGINWASMLELGLRSLSWIAAIHFLLGAEDLYETPPATGDAPWLIDMCLGLDRQLSHVEANLSYYFSPNTHLTGEALALYVAGTALPELAGSRRWAGRGRRVLLEQAVAQVGADGGHIERSTHYHRYTLDFYTLALQTAIAAGDADAAAVFREVVHRLATFMRAMTDDEGRMPLIGDDDGGQLWPMAGRDPRDVRDSLSLAALLLRRSDLTAWDLPEEVFWLAPGQVPVSNGDRTRVPARPTVATHVFPETGFVSVHTRAGDHLVFDVGPHGFGNGGHAHADALSLTLTVGRRPLLVDPGTATYTMDAALRDRMRSSLLHNTVTFDRRSPSEPGGPFRWLTAAHARLHVWRGSDRLMMAQASHDGYAPLSHHRTIVHGCEGWLVVDEAHSTSSRPAEARWHFDPAWSVHVCDARCARADAGDGAAAYLCVSDGDLTLIRGAADRAGGWVSPRYGSLVPAWTLSVQSTIGPGDAMLTWVGVEPGPHRLTRLIFAAAGAHGASLEAGTTRVVTVLDRAGHERSGAFLASDGYVTDAGLLQYSQRAEGLTLALLDGTRAETGDGRLLSVASAELMHDLFAGFDGVTLQLWAGRPPSELRVRGGAVGRAQRLVLNGVERRRPAASEEGTLTLRATDWPSTAAPAPDGDTNLPTWASAPGAIAQPAAS